MRHGRKSKTQCFDGYKRHVARDIDEHLILAAEVTPGNQFDAKAVETLWSDIDRQDRDVISLLIDRGYLPHEHVWELANNGVSIVCRPPANSNNKTGGFSKRNFDIDTETMQATCPAGEIVSIQLGKTAHFPAERCAPCSLRKHCTAGSTKYGRTIAIHPQETLHQQLLANIHTRQGHEALRERVDVEHSLAHISQRQGNRARFAGVRKNTFHLRLADHTESGARTSSRES